MMASNRLAVVAKNHAMLTRTTSLLCDPGVRLPDYEEYHVAFEMRSPFVLQPMHPTCGSSSLAAAAALSAASAFYKDGMYAIPAFKDVIPMDAPHALMTELLGDWVVCVGHVLYDPNGEECARSSPVVCLAPSVAQALLVRKNQSLLFAQPVDGPYGAMRRSRVDLCVAATFALLSTQFRRALNVHVLSDDACETAWKGFVVHPEWIWNLRAEKAGCGGAVATLLEHSPLSPMLKFIKLELLEATHSLEHVQVPLTRLRRLPCDNSAARACVRADGRSRGSSSNCLRPEPSNRTGIVAATLHAWSGTRVWTSKQTNGRALVVRNPWFFPEVWDALFL